MPWFQKITNSMQGRTTTFLVLFFVTGNVLQICGKLDASYIAFFGTFMAAAIGHSLKEDRAPAPAPAPDDKDKGAAATA